MVIHKASSRKIECVVDNDLSGPERLVRNAFPSGTWVDLRVHDSTADDLQSAGSWDSSRTIRADVVAALMLGVGADELTLQSHGPLPEQVPQEIPIPSAPDSVGRSLLVMTRRGCSFALPVSVTISAVTGVRPSPP